MIDQPLASRLAREGFELWEAGRLNESYACYVKAFEVADPDHWAFSAYHGEFAGVLAALGRIDEATSHFEAAIASELARGGNDTSPGVLIGRYFLADHLTRNGAPQRALEALAPALRSTPNDWLICLCHAEALFALGKATESRAAAERAIANAPNAEKAAQLKVTLGPILESSGGPVA